MDNYDEKYRERQNYDRHNEDSTAPYILGGLALAVVLVGALFFANAPDRNYNYAPASQTTTAPTAPTNPRQ
jgi:hypothetical protein